MSDKSKSVSVPKGTGSGYPVTDVGKEGVMSKGRWINNPGTKSYLTMRGGGAATKGKKFLDN